MLEAISTITSKGQVTIPKAIRDQLGLKQHDKIAFVIQDDGTVQLRVPHFPSVASLAGIAGTLEHPLSWEEMRDIAREDHLVSKYYAKPLHRTKATGPSKTTTFCTAMREPCVDTDIIIRLVTGDDPVKQVAAQSFFEQVERGALTISAPITVIADAVYVLSSPRLYHLSRPVIADALSHLVRLSHFHIRNRQVVLRALALYATTSLDFGDVCIVASMERSSSTVLYSYDHGFDRFTPAITRQEP